jgi:hypothetical protein
MHEWGYVKNRKQRLRVAWVFIVNSFFSRAKYTRIVAHEQPWRPHGQPAYQLARHDVLFHLHPEKNTPAVQGIKNPHLQQANALV